MRPNFFLLLVLYMYIVPAMWIRDSTNQIAPYLRFIKQDERLRDLVFGVLQVQASFLNYDPYANAFLRPWYAPKKDGQKRGSTSDRVVPSYDPDIVWESKVKKKKKNPYISIPYHTCFIHPCSLLSQV